MNKFIKTTDEKTIETEMKKSYLSYATSIIINRALPDVRDGLKPVQRKIIYAMLRLNNTYEKNFKKSARIVGDVIGKYHPHGENAVYDAIVRMAQPFTFRYKLIEGQGNFGSIDGDPAAAMRYTEIKLTKLANLLVDGLDKKTVNYIVNYDGTDLLPETLPTKIPNILINGTTGIAVGFATSIPPHNLKETMNALISTLKNPKIKTSEILQYLPGPDFPTGGIIESTKDILNMYQTGRGKIILKAKIHENKNELIVTELPYQINKLNLIEKITQLVKTKKIIGITNITDETDKDGIRIVIELQQNIKKNFLIETLYKYTPLQTTYSVNMIALVYNKPQKLTLRKLLVNFLEYRKNIVINKLTYEKELLNKKIHILSGLDIVHENINLIINTIKTIKTKKNIKEILSIKLKENNILLTKDQLQTTLELPLYKLSNLEKEVIKNNINKYKIQIENHIEIINNKKKLNEFLEKEFEEIILEFEDTRKTIIEHVKEKNIDEKEKNIEKEIIFIITKSHETITKYLLHTNVQDKNSKGKKLIKLKENDKIELLELTTTHSRLFLITPVGVVYIVNIQNLQEIEHNKKVKSLIEKNKLNNYVKKNIINALLTINKTNYEDYLIITTKNGLVKKIALQSLLEKKKQIYKIILNKKYDQISNIKKIKKEESIIIITTNGKLAYFDEKFIKLSKTNTQGTKILKFTTTHSIAVTLIIEKNDTHIILITKNGYGKCIQLNMLKKTNINHKYITIQKTNDIITGESVYDKNKILIFTSLGIVKKININSILKQKKNTKSIKLINLEKNDSLQKIKKIL